MSWIVLIVVAVVTVAALVVNEWKEGFEGLFMMSCGALVVLFLCLLVMGGEHIGRDYSRRRCGSYAEQTERNVRFIQTAYWDWDCYVKTDLGWIRTSSIIKIEEEGKS